jgi:hypothetical protein
MEVDVRCPYCGEPTVLDVDEAGGQSVEDCTVCCRPINVSATVDPDGQPEVSVGREDD